MLCDMFILTFRIASEASVWLGKLMHFPGSSSHCHDDIREGLVRTVRMVLHHRFPGLREQGFQALQANPRNLRDFTAFVETVQSTELESKVAFFFYATTVATNSCC